MNYANNPIYSGAHTSADDQRTKSAIPQLYYFPKPASNASSAKLARSPLKEQRLTDYDLNELVNQISKGTKARRAMPNRGKQVAKSQAGNVKETKVAKRHRESRSGLPPELEIPRTIAIPGTTNLSAIVLGTTQLENRQPAWTIFFSEAGLSLEMKNISEMQSVLDELRVYVGTNQSHDMTPDSVNEPGDNSRVMLRKNKLLASGPILFDYLKPTTPNPSSSSRMNLNILKLQLFKVIFDDCIMTYLNCTARRFPTFPQKTVLDWYTYIEDPMEDIMACTIIYSCIRHSLQMHQNTHLVAMLGMSNVELIRDHFREHTRALLGERFDEPSLYNIYAACYLAMNRSTTPDQARIYYSIADRMASEVNVKPINVDELNEKTVDDIIGARVWWLVFTYRGLQWIDMLTHQTGIFLVQTGMMPIESIPKIDMDTVLGPNPCSLDTAEAMYAVYAWGHESKLWEIQNSIWHTFYSSQQSDSEAAVDALLAFEDAVIDWYRQIPDFFKVDSNDPTDKELTYTASLELKVEFFATLLTLHKVFMPSPDDPEPLTPAARKSLHVCLDCASLMISLIELEVDYGRKCAIEIHEFGRAIDIAITCLKMSNAGNSRLARDILVKGIAVLKRSKDYLLSGSYANYIVRMETALNSFRDLDARSEESELVPELDLDIEELLNFDPFFDAQMAGVKPDRGVNSTEFVNTFSIGKNNRQAKFRYYVSDTAKARNVFTVEDEFNIVIES